MLPCGLLLHSRLLHQPHSQGSSLCTKLCGAVVPETGNTDRRSQGQESNCTDEKSAVCLTQTAMLWIWQSHIIFQSVWNSINAFGTSRHRCLARPVLEFDARLAASCSDRSREFVRTCQFHPCKADRFVALVRQGGNLGIAPPTCEAECSRGPKLPLGSRLAS